MSSEHPTRLRREQPIQKAARLIAEDRVTMLPAARVYEVVGETGTYLVTADPEGIYCPCAARTSLCAHVLAVAQIRLREQAPAPLLRDVLGGELYSVKRSVRS